VAHSALPEPEEISQLLRRDHEMAGRADRENCSGRRFARKTRSTDGNNRN
jgi:hypothetical protein